MSLDDLIITQSGLRDTEPLVEMVAFVKRGGLFTQDAIKNGTDTQLISIVEIEGLFYIHNGHHRLLSIHLGGRIHLDPSEYTLTTRTYDEYLACNFAENYLTPFDPRTEVRVANFREIKDAIRSMWGKMGDHPEVHAFVASHGHLYKLPRQAKHIRSLATPDVLTKLLVG